jgi:hypothetical protein
MACECADNRLIGPRVCFNHRRVEAPIPGVGSNRGTEAKLPETGNYGLIINYFDTSAGSYHFPFRSGLDALSR